MIGGLRLWLGVGLGALAMSGPAYWVGHWRGGIAREAALTAEAAAARIETIETERERTHEIMDLEDDDLRDRLSDWLRR